jgi:glycogen(starch) synthase
MGRPETGNKGFDLHLKSLGALNDTLKAEGSTETVVTFFLIPIGCLRLRPAVAAQLTLYRHMRERLSQIGYRQQRQLFADLCTGTKQDYSLLPEEREELDDDIARMPLPKPPPVSPYELQDEGRDDILRLTAQYGLHNRSEDRVKVLYFPLYLDGFDGIFDLPLYSLIAAFDLGVFPSRYEPWGYTPMESLAVGVPAITSTLAGFGRSIAESRRTQPTGVFMLDREKADDDSVSLLTNMFRTSLKETPRQWTERRISAYQTVQLYSWKHLYQNYRQAYNR